MTSKLIKDTVELVPRRELTLSERVGIITEYENGLNADVIGQNFHCSRAQIRRILLRKADYLELWTKSTDKEAITVRRLSSPLLAATGRILHEWILRASQYMEITDELLRQMGEQIARHINYEGFKSNNRWLGRFKMKYKLNNFNLPRNVAITLGTENRQSLDLEDIIETIRRTKPSILPEFDKKPSSVHVEKEPPLAELERFVDDADTYGSDDSSKNISSEYFYTSNVGDDDKKRKSGTMQEDTVINEMEYAREIKTYKDAINMLGPLEQFLLIKENIRAVGLINQLEILFRDEMAKELLVR